MRAAGRVAWREVQRVAHRRDDEGHRGHAAREFAGRKPGATEENIQSRCRMLLLMGISNKTGKMLLTTGNKSEMAVGTPRCTATWPAASRRSRTAASCWCTSSRVPQLGVAGDSAARDRRAAVGGAAPDQKDSDSLPPTKCSIRSSKRSSKTTCRWTRSARAASTGPTVVRVLDLVKRNEYKRRQAPPGVRVSRRAFGRDWRYPITSGYRR
jgi:NAD+ synthase (glutamine-hydrolysing)